MKLLGEGTYGEVYKVRDTVTGEKLRAGLDGIVLQQVLVRRGSVLVNNPSQSERRDFVPSINRVSATASHALSVLLREATLRADKAGKKMATICLYWKPWQWVCLLFQLQIKPHP